MPKLSVIVPVYNVEQYIERCAHSLLEQTLDDIEYIFIDDCTPDKSISIIEQVLSKYPNKRKNTIIYHQETNKGLPAARTKGLELSTGEYIIHCDSDDWLDVDLYEKMYNKAVSEGADIVLCDEIEEYGSFSKRNTHYDYPGNACEIIQNIRNRYIGMYVHNKMVKRIIYTDNNVLPYPDINMWEDNGLMYRLFYYAEKVAQINDSFYHYNRANVTSITYRNYSGADSMIRCADLLADFFSSKPNGDEFYDMILTLKYIAKLELVADSYANVKRFLSIYPEANKKAKLIDKNSFSKQGRIRFWFATNNLCYVFVFFFRSYLSINQLYSFVKKRCHYLWK